MRLVMNERQDIVEPEVTISYREIYERIKRIADFVRSVDETILCRKENEEYAVSLCDIFYAESVDKKTFVYCERDVYQSNFRIYELEEMLKEAGFVRVSKSTILNIGVLKGVKRLVNSKLEAVLLNGESVCVTRKYLKDIKEALQERGRR